MAGTIFRKERDAMTQFYHLFPFEKVQKDSRLVLYGAGEVGQWYLAQLRQSGFARVVAIADRDWEKYPSLGVPLIAPEKIKEMDFDCVLVSIESVHVAKKVAQMLTVDYDIMPNKIMLGNDSLGEIPIFLKPGMKRLPPPMWEDDCIPVAVCLSGGLGDCLIYKRKLEEVLAWNKHIIIDCFVKESMIGFMHSFFDGEYEGRIRSIISGEHTQFLLQKEYYALALVLTIDVEDVFFDENRLCAMPALFFRIRHLQEQVQSYGRLDTSHYVKHYARCAKDGLNCYTSYNRYDGFDVKDFHTHIPMKREYAERYAALKLDGSYITVNYGFDEREGMPNCKSWPLEYFVQFVASFHDRFPDVQVIQVGGDGFPRISGCDRYFLGESLELVKYILRGAVFHLDIEGGLVHLASQLDTKCVVLFGPTPLAYYGYPKNINLLAGSCQDCCWYTERFWRCYRGMKEPECMYSIKPDKVFAVVEKQFQFGGE